ncbi:GNAT family N-acetyltransferase [Nocardioides sp. B-3]|uniref:GNAT family N-acetyltransferase n=1 Tax=Nocardioides sp. B-3 TaxID=2895565 RepID=UPI00215250EF|nr:GNAT family protein [Nocardioides sp. B-3]UUZ60611.1 GNAT family N-acetyltransferase [Nocardioides sp. B-3]
MTGSLSGRRRCRPATPIPRGSYARVIRRLRRLARQGRAMPFAVEVGGRFAGQVTVNNIVRGSAQFASIGYWLDRAVAGRGVMPIAVAMVIDHCFTAAGLHRVEISIRPENSNSLRVVEKLGMHEVGYAPRFLHINGEWRDHRIFAVTVEDCPEGMLRASCADISLESHEFPCDTPMDLRPTLR